MFKKILIANRGEIALRVMRTCREMGIEVVAVFSEADRTAPHVLFADEAYHIGPAPSTESYLNYAKILEVARESGAEAIHPGYGFLSENTDFASDVSKAGIVFIGPPASAIKIMGDKTMARQTMLKTQVPVVPGTEEPIADISKAQKVAEEIGFPVLIKAAGGGGGKGMRIVNSSDEFEDAVGKAERESQSAFGDGRVYVEKYLEEPHHIEFQILADTHGNTIHLNERECSIQRRYQKVIEESPSPFIDDSLRSKMGQAAVETAESCKYVGAGTVEFLVDKHRNFYFLEMNTRLQVEHPVTEMVTGIDLVAEQIRIAFGQPLSVKQSDINTTGHAIECRIYAEDASNDFAPSTGEIVMLQIPDGAGTRFDGAIRQGIEITPYYDPMLGKLICWAKDRDSALNRSERALREFYIGGIETTIQFCRSVVKHPIFREGTYDTHFYTNFRDELHADLADSTDEVLLVAGGSLFHHQNQIKHSSNSSDSTKKTRSNWVSAQLGRNA
ncbi:MAG: acetyl-CoA carboxylase biotin carboxylase subunit [Candidatus Marinimicrobia bacterium]|jgi:acetyl-CoA carboxylase biotin carboxylase subunit|nr:acetyl-CoA carboxylase biotin carboxylase subunit [Candidatus Neomarinimicrobiota bacterium]MBT3575155.1 acetyl-CoA carboxylase biotin carboxylase subunit [Candidatus Neomarinimicrobiota bacterium]MBT3681058.1 acetyl-CoA carboxylase biotin carboxylase subunit [Candidatus Neomarinimicrobiota bacterium]MBT3951451.1 acetyl-CoA carboxylase biotin carboxylase subunit [Candidatus Neomarinimicrobiota bacterium]MBT4252883.1 acetyl-CoA carboxylase biotin carboxylase subunit [Candidatus Neomarinimicro